MRIKAVLTILAITITRLSAVEPFFEWFGEETLPGSQPAPPAIVDGELGSLKELEFRAGDSNPGEANFVSLQPRPGVYQELTIAFFIKPERREKVEDLVYSPELSLRKVWMKWALLIGPTYESEKIFSQERDTHLTVHEWSHLALTFKEGSVKFYKNGILTESHESTATELKFPTGGVFRIGAGPAAPPSVYYGFAGRMGGIYMAPVALEEADILGLMKRAKP